MPDVAEVRIDRIVSRQIAEATVVSPIKGFVGVGTFTILSGTTSCDVGVREPDVGSTFFVAGRLTYKVTGQVFQGAWRSNW